MKLSRVVRAGSLVGVGPSGQPPAGLRTFEVVDSDPSSVLARPAGSLAFLRSGLRGWMNVDGTPAGWADISALGTLGPLSPQLAALAADAAAIYLMVHGHASGLQLIVPPAANLIDGDWFRILTGVDPVTTIDVEVRKTTGHAVTPGRYEWDIRTLTTATECYAALWPVLAAHTSLTNPIGGEMGGLWYQTLEWPTVGIAGNVSGNEDHVADAAFSLPAAFTGGLDPLPPLETCASILVALAAMGTSGAGALVRQIGAIVREFSGESGHTLAISMPDAPGGNTGDGVSMRAGKGGAGQNGGALELDSGDKGAGGAADGELIIGGSHFTRADIAVLYALSQSGGGGGVEVYNGPFNAASVFVGGLNSAKRYRCHLMVDYNGSGFTYSITTNAPDWSEMFLVSPAGLTSPPLSSLGAIVIGNCVAPSLTSRIITVFIEPLTGGLSAIHGFSSRKYQDTANEYQIFSGGTSGAFTGLTFNLDATARTGWLTVIEEG